MTSASFRPRILALSALCCFTVVGCKSAAAPDDATLLKTVQSQIAADSALSGQSIQPSVQNAKVTLTGAVANDAQRTIAARDAAGVAGVHEVDNKLTLASAVVVAPPPAPLPIEAPVTQALVKPVAPVKAPGSPRAVKPQYVAPEPQYKHQPAPIERSQQAYDSQPQQAYQPPVQQAPPPPPQPVFRNVTLTVGSILPVRVTQTLDSATTQQGDSFSGTVASDILVDGIVAIPAGSTVSGHVDEVHEAAHFKGSSLLTVSLATLNRRGGRIPLSTDPYTVQGKGRGANTAEKIGGGAAVGAILGGIFGGGKGAAIGAGAGGAVGAGANTVTRGQQVQIPSETIVRFHLATPITIRTRADGNQGNGDNRRPLN